MAEAINPTTHGLSTPYLTNDEYKRAPTAIDIDNLVFNSSDPVVQENELANVIARASSWIDTYCNQVLGATIETESQRTRVSSDGYIKFHPRYNPVIALTALQFGNPSTNLITVNNVASAWIEDQQVLYPYAQSASLYTSQGPLQLGTPYAGDTVVYIKYSYVNGYANTTIVTAEQGDSEIIVASGLGIVAGLQMTIYDGLYSERVTVADTYVFGSTTVPLVLPLAHDHVSGVAISALPPAIKEACILATTAMLKVRGDASMTMGIGTQPNNFGASDVTQDIGDDMSMAMALLKPYRRIR